VNKNMDERVITSKEEARQYAIDWQHWQSEQSLSYGEIAKWQSIFEDLAAKYGLVDEFVENGII
jgi:hypothetical protein